MSPSPESRQIALHAFPSSDRSWLLESSTHGRPLAMTNHQIHRRQKAYAACPASCLVGLPSLLGPVIQASRRAG